MAVLTSELRNQLGKAIIKARNIAEAGSRTALESLAVNHHEPFSSMSIEDRRLRNRLRARGRQLGDVRDKNQGTQTIGRLAHEIAYEHWHRILFARFLAENNLLIHPDHDVPVTLQEIDDLARETGENPHAMAARFAQVLLPQIFRTDDPVLEVTLAPEIRQSLEKILDNLPNVVFTADDSLGWTYQYWQAEKKDEVNKSGNKIGADELPAVTQLFTEHYMVQFLYHNTIGAWHAGKVFAENPTLTITAENEGELRQAVRLHSKGGYNFEYLRFVRELQDGDEEDKPTGPWRPAASTFDGWPKTASELKVLDPCCGSGHFLVEGFELLTRLRMDEEELALEDAIRCVISDNLHGLEIDPRCTQIAAFNLALAAWKMIGKPIELPPLHIACSGLAVGSTKSEWTQIAGDDTRLRAGMERLYELFKQAPELGSLIDPKALKGDMFVADFSELQPLLELALEREADNAEDAERAVAAQGMARAAELLSSEYTLAITNVPYLGRGLQSDLLKNFAIEFYNTAKADLATIFVERILHLLEEKGSSATVTPQNWLFLTGYKKLRMELLKNQTWNFVARLGPKGFQTSMWDFNVMLIVLSGEPIHKDHLMAGIDVSSGSKPFDKASLLRGEFVTNLIESQTAGSVHVVSQSKQVSNPDSRIQTTSRKKISLLIDYADSYQGICTGDYPRFGRNFWEVSSFDLGWKLQQSTVSGTGLFGGLQYVFLWNDPKNQFRTFLNARLGKDNHGSWVRGLEAWGLGGITISQTGSLYASVYAREAFDNNAAVIIPKNNGNIGAIWAYCASEDYAHDVRDIDQSLKVTNQTLLKVPFDLEHWQKVADDKYPNGLPEPKSNDPTQWIFHGHPANADPSTILQVAVGRLLGYRWPTELNPEMRLDDEAREWVARCYKLKEYADNDGIVCLSATRGERSAADRLRTELSAAFGSGWSAVKERELLEVAGNNRKPAASLEVWLRDKFFTEHCKLFHHRPLVWHIWDGNKTGFHCLVNVHKLTGPDGEGRRTLEAITYSYLGDWIERQRAEQHEGKEGADARLAAAQDLQGQLEKILQGEPPYDIFVRWKSLNEQAIGWEPDINDGVRLNIRPFMKAELQTGGRRGAGILRWEPNIKWNKDRGKEPQSIRPKEDYPWFWSCPGDGLPSERTDFTGGSEFDGNRWNDLHYTRSIKEEARGLHTKRCSNEN